MEEHVNLLHKIAFIKIMDLKINLFILEINIKQSECLRVI